MSQMIMANKDHVASKVMDGEAILINLQTGVYYSFDEVAGVLWSAVERGATEQDMANLLTEHFDTTADAVADDVARFCALLIEEELVHDADSHDTSVEVLPLPAAKAEYRTPEFEKFTDMMEMFALDPPLPGVAQAQS